MDVSGDVKAIEKQCFPLVEWKTSKLLLKNDTVNFLDSVILAEKINKKENVLHT